MNYTCESCGCRAAVNGHCPSCDLYNAAVVAQKAAATAIAKSLAPSATDAWLNEYGVFAWIDGKTARVGTPEQAAPFVALTGAARRVKFT